MRIRRCRACAASAPSAACWDTEKTSAAAMDRLDFLAVGVMREPEIIQLHAFLGAEPVGSTPPTCPTGTQRDEKGRINRSAPHPPPPATCDIPRHSRVSVAIGDGSDRRRRRRRASNHARHPARRNRPQLRTCHRRRRLVARTVFQQPHISRCTKLPRSRSRPSLPGSRSRGRVSIRQRVPIRMPAASLIG